MNEWREFDDPAALNSALAEAICTQLTRDIKEKGSASLAVSGGSTPRELFCQLSQTALDWTKVYICLVDERWVATSSSDSNERLLRENLLQNLATEARFISLKTDHQTASAALPDITQRLSKIPLPFSAVHLGMGSDGHTASWFAQATNLAELLKLDNPNLVAATEPVTAPYTRVTLTLAAVLRSRTIAIHITGSEKKAVLNNAIEQALPVSAVLSQTTTPVTIWWAPS